VNHHDIVELQSNENQISRLIHLLLCRGVWDLRKHITGHMRVTLCYRSMKIALRRLWKCWNFKINCCFKLWCLQRTIRLVEIFMPSSHSHAAIHQKRGASERCYLNQIGLTCYLCRANCTKWKQHNRWRGRRRLCKRFVFGLFSQIWQLFWDLLTSKNKYDIRTLSIIITF